MSDLTNPDLSKRYQEENQSAPEENSALSGLLKCANIVVEKAEDFEHLAGEILATLNVNLERGDLCRPEAEIAVKEMVDNWRKMHKKLKAL